MGDFPDIPAGYGIPLVDLATDLLPAETMAALDELYAGGGGGPGAVTSVNGQTGVVVVTKTDVGLGSVDNTADSAKPVSTAQAAADTVAKARANHTGTQLAATISDLSKSSVGLGNVDNTSDANKPVSTAQATADALAIPKSLVDAKGDILAASANDVPARLPVGTNGQALLANSAAGTGLGWFTLTSSDVGLPNVNNTSDANKPVSTAQAAADALAIPKSLVDAKGDILTATANDTPARLAVGTDGHVLTADSAQATGVKWAAAAGGSTVIATPLTAPTESGAWTNTPGTRVLGVSNTTLNRLWLCPIYIRGNTASISKVSFKTDTAAGAGGIVRAGIYLADTTTWKPTGSPLQVVSVDVTLFGGRWETALPANASVTTPVFFLGIVQQVASGALVMCSVPNPDAYGSILSGDDGFPLEGDAGGMYVNDAYYVDSVSGALGSVTGATFVRPQQYIPRNAVRFA